MPKLNPTAAFLGPKGTFSHSAALSYFNTTQTELIAVDSIDEIFNAVISKRSRYGVVPIENNTAGVVHQTLDQLLLNPSIRLCGEIIFTVVQNLLIDPADTQAIQRIYSHQQSLSQCEKWLTEHFPKVDQIAVKSNAYAAQLAKQETGAAAIAGTLAGKLYGLSVHTSHIENHAQNMTRFLIIGRNTTHVPSGQDRTSLLITALKHEPGVLISVLRPFAKRNVNILLLEWRPKPTASGIAQEGNIQSWEYVFFVDITGHYQDPHVQQTLDELMKNEINVKVLGSYPRAMS